MKVLIVFYKDLEKNKGEIIDLMKKNYELIKRKLGIDNIYATITEEFLEVFKLFPEICLINNTMGTLNFGLYKGLRKLKEDDILVIDAGRAFSETKFHKIPMGEFPSILMDKESWAGIAYIPMREIYYFIKSLEENFDKCITEAFETLKKSYGINFIKSFIS
ncbi:MAG: hypothetical protein DSY32_02600 [Aquifex sp.]|nr:MAG: hypothetical protein DSY32_02600 [Aquifex sp.]